MAIGALALTACSKIGGGQARDAQGPAQANGPPARRAGLWEQTMVKDGKPLTMAAIRICVDSSTESRFAVFGEKAGKEACRRNVRRDLDGAYAFTSICNMGQAGTVTSRGNASGDFSSRYRVHTDNTVTGSSIAPLNGHHVIDLDVRYAGPCPAGMSPGQVSMANGFKVNLGRLGEAARAFGAGT
jgi:hypothetical protein